MRPKQTKYKNIFFRSRTEARWAVFFDVIGYRWQYEEEGYLLSSNEGYLPDFKLLLPDDSIFYAEVKHYEFDDLGDEKIITLRKFCRESDVPLLILPGTPEYRAYNLIFPDHNDNSFCAALFQDYTPYIRIADEYWFRYLVMDSNGRFMLDVDDRSARKSFGRKYVEAIYTARSAHFEHGENPNTSVL